MNPYVTPDLFDFLVALKSNNNREWFAANKPQYERHVKQPLLQFISDFAPALQEISPEFLAIPKATGGSLFRVYRDTRFSNDKTPYKTHAAIQFRHRAGKDAHAPGFYLHFEPGNVIIGGGIWHPDSRPLLKLRTAIADDPESWENILKSEPFASTFEQAGDVLKRPPKGFDPDHPLIDELKRKDFFGLANLDDDVLFGPDLLPTVADTLRLMVPYMSFLTSALGLAF